MTEEGIPCIYYGTEQDCAGGNDPANREVLWNTGFKADEGRWPDLPPHLEVVYATSHTLAEDDAGIIAYERAGGDAGASYALVIINTNSRHQSTTADGPTAMKITRPGVTLIDVLNSDGATYAVPASGGLRVVVPKQGALILVPQDQLKP